MNDPRPNIWLLQAQNDSKALIAALQNDDTNIRKRAAAALRILGAIEAIPALRDAIDNEQNAATKEHLKLVLDNLLIEYQQRTPTMPDATRELVEQLQSSNPAVIVKAAHKLGKLNDKTAVEALVLIFNNTDLPAHVRLSAADSLIELKSAPAVVTLLAALRSPSWRSRRNAAAILGQLRADWATARLAEYLDDESEQVRRTAYAALKYIDTAEARAALAKHDGTAPEV